jgi:hypothetical protein
MRRTASFSIARTPGTVAAIDRMESSTLASGDRSIRSANSRTQQQNRVHRNDAGRPECRPVIGGFPSHATDDGNQDPYERRRRGKRVTEVVPCIGPNSHASDLGSDCGDTARQEHLYRHHDDQHDQCPPRRRVMRRSDLAYRLNRNGAGRAKQHQRDDGARKRFRLAIPERVVLIRLTTRDLEAAQHNCRGYDVCAGLDGIGDERVRITDNAGHELERGEQRVRQNSDRRRSLAARQRRGIGSLRHGTERTPSGAGDGSRSCRRAILRVGCVLVCAMSA